MAIHDWTRVDAGIFHDFQHTWIAEIARALNRGLLPRQYYALLERPTIGAPPTFDPMVRDTLETDPRQVLFPHCSEPELYAAKAKVVMIRHASNHRAIARVEIVSPGNKTTKSGLRHFVRQAVEALKARIHLLILDLFPPGSCDPQGIHKAIWDEFRNSEFALPSDQPLMLAAYIGGTCPEAYIDPVAVGASLPEMPLFLAPDTYILAPLETTYQAAWEAVPSFWRDVLTGHEGS